MTTPAPILSTNRVRRFRLQARLSERALARATAMTGMSIRALEQGRNHDELTLRHLVRIARALGVDPAALLTPDPAVKPEPRPDDVMLEAALAGINRYTHPHDLARGLGWTLDRTTAALEQLRLRLETTGQRLANQNGRVKIVPAAGLLTDSQEHDLANASTNERGLTISLAQMLRQAIEDNGSGGRTRKPNANELLAQGALLNLGMIEFNDGRLVATRDVAYGVPDTARTT
jgi:transcriptional regulator with XRE-family HTH domain